MEEIIGLLQWLASPWACIPLATFLFTIFCVRWPVKKWNPWLEKMPETHWKQKAYRTGLHAMQPVLGIIFGIACWKIPFPQGDWTTYAIGFAILYGCILGILSAFIFKLFSGVIKKKFGISEEDITKRLSMIPGDNPQNQEK